MPIRRLARLVVRRPVGTLAALTAVSLWGAVAVNALALQGGPHPAPLLGRGDLLSASLSPHDPAPQDAQRQREADERRALVRELQQLLTERGFYVGEVDGLAGPMTEEAIRAFEAAAGLEVTGKPRAVLLAHIELSSLRGNLPSAATQSDSGSPPPLAEDERSIPAEPEETGLPSMSTLTEADLTLHEPEPPAEDAPEADPRIEAVQRVLAELGYAPGPIDGQLGPRTADAIRRFQHDRGLEATGQLDAHLLRELSIVSGVSLG